MLSSSSSMFSLCLVVLATSLELGHAQDTKMALLHTNPYTSWRRSTAAAANLTTNLQPSPSSLQYQYVNSTARRAPQWAKVRNHHILVGYGRAPANVDNASDTGNRSLLRSKFEKRLQEQEQVAQSVINIQQVPQDFQQQQEASLPHYNCDSIIRDQASVIESPHYPATYPVNRICTYYLAKHSADVCQIEVTIFDMDIEDTPQCTNDYLDLSGGGNAVASAEQRLCGLMLRNTQRLLTFPANGSYIRLTFHSDGQNAQPHRGFSAEVRQLPNSCNLPRYYPNGTATTQTIGYGPSAVHPTQTPLAGVYPGYGQRLYPTTRPPYILRPVGTGRKDATYPYQPPISQHPIGPPVYPTHSITNFTDRSLRGDNLPIYLESYCDIYLSEVSGELRSPNYPFGYPANHTCIYTIKRAAPDVCQVEVIFHHFDIQTGGEKKDLTENCHGDYLEMPDHRRLCGYYNQAMSKDHLFKKFYFFRDTTNYLFLQFTSDNQPSPDGSGFWIEIRQLRNSCPVGFDSQKALCDRVISGQYSTVERVYSPNFPSYYQPLQQCVYFIQPSDGTTCEFELDLVQFDLEPNKDTTDEYGCAKDYVQLPDRKRICGRTLFRRMFTFPRYHKRTSMFYFQTDKDIENRGFEIVVRQFPNTCNHTGNALWNANMPPLDPNLRSPGFNLNPTPVFTYSNTSGLHPYMPPIIANTLPGTKHYGTPFWGKKGGAGTLPTYLVQDLLNNPRNVDATGTIPLYFANGTLATRIPPLKPIDLIPYLKKGKTFTPKIGSLLPVNDPRNLYSTGRGTSSANDILNNPRSPNINNNNNNEAEVFDSSAKLREFSPRTGFGPRSDYMPTIELQPTYSCDQVVNRNIEYVRSPNFPSNYPTVTRCIYSIVKSDINVCQVRLNILSLDLEYTNGCRNDYFMIETTGEKLCGRLSAPETRVINYYGFSRDIRLIFNSDRQTTGAGFEVRVEQVPNSCDEGNNNNRTLNREVATLGGSNPAVAGRSFTDPVRGGRLIQSNQPPSAQALVTPNALNTTTITNVLPASSPRICRTTAVPETIFESDNFPLPYPGGVDCLYKIFRANRNVCRLEIEFVNFSVGTAQMDMDRTELNRVVEQQTMETSAANCINDFLEIDSIRYCGNREGKKVAISFPRMLSEVSMRFVTFASDRFSGFRIKVNQIDQNCRSPASASGLLSSASLDEMSSDFTPAIIESCAKISDNSKESANIHEELVRVQSPKFGLPSTSTFGYEPFLDCDYVVAKASRDVCALEIRFKHFALEESRSCTKDYLEVNHLGMRLCGALARNAVRTFDFPEDTMRLHLHTDGDRNDTGFAIILRQIRC